MRFFFYGTLMAGAGNPVARTLHRRLRAGIAATVRGRLVAVRDPLGWYPALVPGNGQVRGRLHATRPGFSPRDLALIDGWEGYDPARPHAGDYARVALAVRAGGGAARAQGYVWCGRLPAGCVPVPRGDFAAFLAARRARGYQEGRGGPE